MSVPKGYKRTEAGVIPEEWESSTIGDEFHIQLGKMLDTEKNVGVPRPFLGNRSVQWDKIDVSDLGAIKLATADLERFRLREGDLLVCEGGEVGRAAIWTKQLNECYYQKALHRLRAKRGYNVQLAKNLLHRYASTGALSDFVTQTSIAHLPKDKFEKLPIPVPPPFEQRAIAEALGDVDALLGALDAAIAKQRDLKQATMQQLLTGQTRLPGFAGEWEVRCLGSLGTFLKGSGVKKDEATSGDLPCVRYGEIYTHHHDVVRVFSSFISSSVASGSTPLRKGDILFAGSGETKAEIGKAVAFVHDCPAYASGDIIILRPDASHPVFLGYSLNNAPVQKQKASRGQGDAVVHIGAASLVAIKIVIPSLPEQTAIATILTDLDATLTVLESRRTKTAALKQAMMQSLLTGRIRLV